MPDLFTVTDDLSALEPPQLHALYREIQQVGSTRELTEQELFRACAIMRALRRKSSGPPKPQKAKASRTPTNIGLDDL